MKKVENNNAITLIALVITIIVLLILAGVTINLTLGENGIFKTAEMAGKNYTQAQEDELAGLAGFENTINNVIGGLGNSDTSNQLVTKITLNKTNTTIKKGKTENLTATVEPSNASNKTIKWSSSDASKVTVENGLITAVDVGTATITAEAIDGSGVKATCNVVVEDLPSLKDTAKPGDYVKYDAGEKGVLTFRVLYNDDTYGLQIISAGNVEDIRLGTSGSDLAAYQSSMNDYNTAITKLNNAAYEYAKSSPYALDGRCVGSVPTIGADGKFNAKNTETSKTYTVPSNWTMPSGFSSRDTGCQKGVDTNYETDYNTMKALQDSGASNMLTTGAYYWLASHDVGEFDWGYYFRVRYVLPNSSVESSNLCAVESSGTLNGTSQAPGLRPVISLGSNVKVVGGGDGTSVTKAFELGI